MANKITVNTSTITNKAGELKTLNSSLKKQIEELTSTESALNAMWEGDANDAFHKAFSQDVVQMNNFYNAIEKYITSLQEIVSTYEKAEHANLNTASTRSYK